MSKIMGWLGKSSRPSNGKGVDHKKAPSLNHLTKRSEFDRSSLPISEDYYLNIMCDDLQVMKTEARVNGNRCASLLQSLEGKTIQITAVNIDVVNSSEKVKMLSSEEAGEYYQTFIENTSDLIESYGGYVLKNVGDCVLGFFPCSKYVVENHDSAVLCGLAMRSMINDSLNPYFMERKLPSIACRISADFGAAKVLRVTSNGGYSAIDLFGSALNSAAKISQYAKPSQMVIGDNLFWKLINMNDFEFRLINRFSLTGNHSYPVYLVERRRGCA